MATETKAAKAKTDAFKRIAVGKVQTVKASEIVRQNANQKPRNASGENPYREGGSYHAVVSGLRSLGLNRLHSFDAIVPAVRKAMGSAYKAFARKDARNDETGKDARERIIQNVSVVARKDYGAPLRKVGFEVRYDGREKQAGLFRLSK